MVTGFEQFWRNSVNLLAKQDGDFLWRLKILEFHLVVALFDGDDFEAV